jgi:hypothetical protein
MDKPEEVLTSAPVPVRAETISWLKERLSAGSQRIAALTAEWCGGQQVKQPKGGVAWEGGRDGTNSRWLAELMQARGVLGVEAYLDDHSCYCWRLPRGGLH